MNLLISLIRRRRDRVYAAGVEGVGGRRRSPAETPRQNDANRVSAAEILVDRRVSAAEVIDGGRVSSAEEFDGGGGGRSTFPISDQSLFQRRPGKR